MVRQYKREPGGKTYRNYSEETLHTAVEAVRSKQMSAKGASRHYGVPRATLQDKVKSLHLRQAGGQTVLSKVEETAFSTHLLTLAEYGFPITLFELRIIVKAYLDKAKRTESRFKNNFPGKDWALLFLKRHKVLTQRMAANIKRARAKVSPTVVSRYFENLKDVLEGVPPQNIFNYDETNLSDDPGCKRVITKRGCKYPERVANHSKACTSVMFCGSASGDLMPPYVVYKSENLWSSWAEGGPKGARYNRTPSGWFDESTFEDWFESLALPILKKVLIGDNLSSHLSYNVIQLCEEYNISFVSLPPNSTHLTQPLDVAFFRPLKYQWKKVLNDWKLNKGDKPVSKDVFPRLLKKVIDEINMNSQPIISGFRKCGIFPIDANAVLSRIPAEVVPEDDLNVSVSSDVSVSVLAYLSEEKYGKNKPDEEPRRRKKVNVEPGKSITTEDVENLAPQERENRKQS